MPISVRILVVENCPVLAEAFSSLFKLWGHEVRVTHAGQAALSVAREYVPDLMLVDLDLADPDVWDAARQLRAELRHGLLIAISDEPLIRQRARRLRGVFAHAFPKPIDPLILQSLIAQAWVRPEPQAPVETEVLWVPKEAAGRPASLDAKRSCLIALERKLRAKESKSGSQLTMTKSARRLFGETAGFTEVRATCIRILL
jgi:CheY-like chemotaxis protein